ncbi:MAG: porphobilinogen synthase [Candidatus Heimdallarchaeota archaeon]
MFPTVRNRRLRLNKALRDLVAEVEILKFDLICPLFVTWDPTSEILSMPGIYRHNIRELPNYVNNLVEKGIDKFLLFGVPRSKDDTGSWASSPEGIVQSAIKEIKDVSKDLLTISDVCMCQYTSHGHCGIIDSNGLVDSDKTNEYLAKIAVSHAEAGVDIVAPSDMMDGRVRAIRKALDETGFQNTGILSYAAKYRSGFYGPFRDAADSTPGFGDRSTYQMDYRNKREAIKEILSDIEEGADMVMVKPALAYLDIIQMVRDRIQIPIAAYNVSGEFSMIKAAAERGWIDERAVVYEVLTAIKRAGADMIITYFAQNFSDLLES